MTKENKVGFFISMFLTFLVILGGGCLLIFDVFNGIIKSGGSTVSSATAANGLIDSTTINQDGGTISYSVQDYVYLPSYNDIKDGGNYGFEFFVYEDGSCEPTDWALANNVYLDNYCTGMGNKRSTGTCTWWSRSAESLDSPWGCNPAGYTSFLSVYDDTYAVRCALHLNLNSTISAVLGAGNGRIGTLTHTGKTYHTIELDNLMYPQTIVSNSSLKTALNGIVNNSSYKTGKRYAGRTTDITSSSRTTVYSEEYKYNNEYYVYVPQYGYDPYTYSDGTTVALNGSSSVWIKVEPIQWVINNWSTMPTSINPSGTGKATYIEAYSVYGLISGIPFYDYDLEDWEHTNWASWTSSCLRAYLNGYDLNNKNDSNMASIRANFAGEGFIDVIYHEIVKAGGFVDPSTIDDGGGYISYSVEDYAYFPSYNDIKNSGNYGFTSNTDRLCEPTDWALANYAGLNTNYTGMDNIRLMSTDGSCYWWSRSASSTLYARSVADSGSTASSSVGVEEYASRVALHLNLESSISAVLGAGNGRIGTLTHNSKTYHTIELDNLMYPQTIVSNSSLKTALNGIVNDSSYKTGTRYAGRTTSISSSAKSTVYSEEYKYNNEYYVYVPQYGSKTIYTYSDGTTVAQNGASSVWIKVEPIKWIINNWSDMPTSINPSGDGSATYIEAYSVYGIVSGFYFYPNTSTNMSSWTSSCWRAYLNGYDLNSKNDSKMASIKANFAGEGFIDVIYHNLLIPVDKPYATSVTSYTYNGDTIRHDIANFNTNYMTRNGPISATDVGDYTVTFTLKQGYCWSDDNSTDDVTLNWSILKLSLAIPTVSGSFTYDGDQKSAIISSFNTNYITQGGTASATNAGTYTITFTLSDTENTQWDPQFSDETTTPKSGTWTIERAELTIPTINTNPTFQGTSVSVSPTLNNYDGNIMTLSGDTSATSVKTSETYTITISLTPTAKINYQWSSGGTEDIPLSWNVLRKDLSGAEITLPKDSFEYDGEVIKPEPTVKV